MKRLAMATVVLTALAASAQAGDLPKPISLVERMKNYDLSHYPRGAEAGKGAGASSTSEPEAEARKQPQKGEKTAKARKEKAPAHTD